MFFEKIKLNKILRLAAFFVLPLMLTACPDPDDHDPTSDPVQPTPDPTAYTYDIYCSATYDTIISDKKYSRKFAGYFYNNQFVPLYTQDETKDVFAYSICVDGDDVYVAGTEDKANAVYWKNGQVVYLPGGSVATSIAVRNGNVYVCGYDINADTEEACCWINNTKYELKNGTRANSIAVDAQGRVYIVGCYQAPLDFKRNLRYWTNAETETISLYTISGGSCEPKSVCLDESHYTNTKNPHPYMCIGATEVHSAGGSVNKHWIERKVTEVTSPSSGNDLFSVSACNGKIYSCGNDRKIAKYWVADIAKNGAGTNLKSVNLTDGTEQWFAVGIHAVHDMAFVVGYRVPDDVRIPTVWVDGQKLYNLDSPYRVSPSAIYVVPRPIVAPVVPVEPQPVVPQTTVPLP